MSSPAQHLSDEEIVEVVRSQDPEAYAYLIKRYQKKLLRYAMSLVGDEDAAADAVQEAFIQAYIHLQSFRRQLSFSSWIYRITHNCAMNGVRRERRHISEVLSEQIAIFHHVEEDLERSDLARHVQQCVERLPMMYRAPISLYFIHDKSYEEIGDILQISVAVVGVRLHRAKQMIKVICQRQHLH